MAIKDGTFIVPAKGLGEKKTPYGCKSGTTVTAVEEVIRSNFRKVEDLIHNRRAVKAALINANNQILVNIGNQSMTLAQAVDRKNSIVNEKNFLETLKIQTLISFNNVKALMERLETSKETRLASAFAGVDKKSWDKTAVEAVTATLVNDETPSLIDPMGINKVIEEKEANINEFLLNVDYSLSEVNSLNKITVELR